MIEVSVYSQNRCKALCVNVMISLMVHHAKAAKSLLIEMNNVTAKKGFRRMMVHVSKANVRTVVQFVQVEELVQFTITPRSAYAIPVILVIYARDVVTTMSVKIQCATNQHVNITLMVLLIRMQVNAIQTVSVIQILLSSPANTNAIATRDMQGVHVNVARQLITETTIITASVIKVLQNRQTKLVGEVHV